MHKLCFLSYSFIEEDLTESKGGIRVEKETMEMKWKEQMGQQSTQILLEGDMIVPDNKPDLKEVLRCSGTVKLKDKRIHEDRVSFSGELEVCVLYGAKNGERYLYAMQSVLPIEDFIHMEGLEKNAEVMLQTQMEHLNCQIINDRKIAVRAVLEVTAEAMRENQADILCHVEKEGLETLKGKLQMEQQTAELKDHFSVKEELVLPAMKPEIGEVLWEQISLTEQEIRPMDGKAMVRGNVKLEMLYTDPEGNIGSFSEKVPFSGYLEEGGMDSRTVLNGTICVEQAKLTPMPDEDGEIRQVAADITVGVNLQGYDITEQEILLDAYAPKATLELECQQITYPLTVANGKNQFMLKERIQLEQEEQPMLRAEAVWGDVRLGDTEVHTDILEAEGVLMVDILYDCAEDHEPVCMIHRGIPFTQMTELKGIQKGDKAKVSLRLEDMDFQILSEREGELRATLTMESSVSREQTAETVTDMILKEEIPVDNMAGAVIYMVQPKDSLWTIAKRYHTTIADILAVNEIENPDVIYPGQKLLIMKMVK